MQMNDMEHCFYMLFAFQFFPNGTVLDMQLLNSVYQEVNG